MAKPSSSDKPMDDEYAMLSLLAGYFAAIADQSLGREHYSKLIREHAWCLTWEKLAMWYADAMRLGVPREMLQPPIGLLESLPELIQKGMELQKMFDDSRGAQ